MTEIKIDPIRTDELLQFMEHLRNVDLFSELLTQARILNMARVFQGATFRPFTNEDWSAFSGCVSENPYIADMSRGCIILDGNTVQIYDYEPDGTLPTGFPLCLKLETGTTLVDCKGRSL